MFIVARQLIAVLIVLGCVSGDAFAATQADPAGVDLVSPGSFSPSDLEDRQETAEALTEDQNLDQTRPESMFETQGAQYRIRVENFDLGRDDKIVRLTVNDGAGGKKVYVLNLGKWRRITVVEGGQRQILMKKKEPGRWLDAMLGMESSLAEALEAATRKNQQNKINGVLNKVRRILDKRFAVTTNIANCGVTTVERYRDDLVRVIHTGVNGQTEIHTYHTKSKTVTFTAAGQTVSRRAQTGDYKIMAQRIQDAMRDQSNSMGRARLKDALMMLV
ncbi:MAG: hypothetical protein HY592_02140 [Candidatus Omnitrophica bacterium]|nr:hypothetical protein [Candidatus Omnitrophota bacterium]